LKHFEFCPDGLGQKSTAGKRRFGELNQAIGERRERLTSSAGSPEDVVE
jgi:hypothetical protein